MIDKYSLYLFEKAKFENAQNTKKKTWNEKKKERVKRNTTKRGK